MTELCACGRMVEVLHPKCLTRAATRPPAATPAPERAPARGIADMTQAQRDAILRRLTTQREKR